MNESQRQQFMKLSKDKLIEYIDIANKNWWTLQNNWVVNVEEKCGPDIAMELDGICFGRESEVQVYRLKKFFNLDDSISALMKIFDFSQFNSSVEYEFREVTDRHTIFRVTKCPMQLERLKKGLPEVVCKPGAIAVNNRIAKALNPNIKTTCIFCPPDPHSEDAWCEFEFMIEP